jgi:EAL domain-containing protein (putative c-di-GMP-specific phosphodiesterase class I)
MRNEDTARGGPVDWNGMPTDPSSGRRDRRSPTPGAARKREAIRALKEGVAADRVVLNYQPVVEPDGGRVVAVEALMRWRPPNEGPALSELIASAERSPVIFRLENWVLQQSIAAAAGWRDAGVGGLRLNVNLSAREFPRPGLVRRVTRLLRADGLDAGSLGLEITETSAMCHFDEVAAQIGELRAMGVEVWLDDFGTGHSSLEWLGRIPADGVKIPGALTGRLEDDPRIRTIVTRVIDLAHDLGLRVIAEGVETPSQRDILGRAECDLLQGFLFHPPLPPEEVPAAVRGASARLG